jgi:hypothetical protein
MNWRKGFHTKDGITAEFHEATISRAEWDGLQARLAAAVAATLDPPLTPTGKLALEAAVARLAAVENERNSFRDDYRRRGEELTNLCATLDAAVARAAAAEASDAIHAGALEVAERERDQWRTSCLDSDRVVKALESRAPASASPTIGDTP